MNNIMVDTALPFEAEPDPERPFDAYYSNLNRVPWYARMPFAERIKYLDWIVAKREAEVAAWHTEHPDADEWQQLLDDDLRKRYARLITIQRRRNIELADRTPPRTTFIDGTLAEVPLSDGAIHRNHLDSPRWQRTRNRKFVSVGSRCEYPGCSSCAHECHHLHYETLGFEENCDLEALCSHHHRARHGL
jgi:hypothetical protein